MPLILGTNSIKDTGYDVANSCRFDGTSAYLHKATSSGNNTKYTFSAWIKRSSSGSQYPRIFGSHTNAGSYVRLNFNRAADGEQFHLYHETSGGASTLLTNRLFRDPTAWMHILVAVDSTDGTANDRMKIYINGVQETSFATRSNPSQNADMCINNSSSTLTVGKKEFPAETSDFFDGYMAEVHYIDGTAYAPTDFGEFDDSGIWKPIEVSGISYGTNGFYLDFEDSANLGNDANGGTDLTEVNLTAADQTPDTCTNNFATLNPLGFAGTIPTFSQGNLNVVVGVGASLYSVPTIGVSSGKWYVEGELEAATINSGTYYVDYGFHDRTDSLGQSLYVSDGRMFWLSSWDGKINYRTGGSTTTGLVTGLATLTPGDFFQLYLDMDNELMYWGKNGSLLNSTGVSFNGKESLTGEYFFAFGDQYTNGSHEYAVNFGQGSIDGTAVSNYNDANGYGNFKYNPTVTTDEGSKDFLALCTKNLAEYG